LAQLEADAGDAFEDVLQRRVFGGQQFGSSTSARRQAKTRSRDQDGQHLHEILTGLDMPRAQRHHFESFRAPQRGLRGSRRSRSENRLRRRTYHPGGYLVKNRKSENHKGRRNQNPQYSSQLGSRSREASPSPTNKRWMTLWKNSSRIGHHPQRGILHPGGDSGDDRLDPRRVQHPGRQLSLPRTRRSTILSQSFLRRGHRSRRGIHHRGVVSADLGHKAMTTSQTARTEQLGGELSSRKPSTASSGTECCLGPLQAWHLGRRLGP